MQQDQTSIFGRSDTMLGVCQAIGDDFGFNANYLRVALAIAVVFNIEYAAMAYIALGAVVLATRLVFPTRRAAAAPAVEQASAKVVTAEPAHVVEDRIPLAA